MSIYVTYLFYGAIFLSVLLLVEGIFYLLTGPAGTAASPNRRLRMLVGGQKREAVMVRLQRERPLPSSDRASNPVEWFQMLVTQAGVRSSPQRMAVIMAMIGLAIGAVLMVLSRSPLTTGIGLVAGLVMPLLMMLFMRRRRWKQITAQLPDAIDIIVRSLRAGHPVPIALSMVAREMRDPIATEFGLVVDEMTYGLNLDDALSNMARRVGLDDLRFLVVAVTIQVQVGGNLAEILNSLSRVIRDRAKMKAKIRALSAEGRFSALLLSILPFALAGFINLSRPQYYTDVSSDPVFWPVIGVGLLLMAIGIFIMYRLVNFRV